MLWQHFIWPSLNKAGSLKPTPTGKLAGSDVFSYVWPTTLNSSEVGFEDSAGILALAVTSHPDFDEEVPLLMRGMEMAIKPMMGMCGTVIGSFLNKMNSVALEH